MSNQDRIDALPIWQRMQFDNLIASKIRENWIPRNAAAVTEILDVVAGAPDPWAPQPVEEQPEPVGDEAPQTPEEPAAPVEDSSAADGPGDDQ